MKLTEETKEVLKERNPQAAEPAPLRLAIDDEGGDKVKKNAPLQMKEPDAPSTSGSPGVSDDSMLLRELRQLAGMDDPHTSAAPAAEETTVETLPAAEKEQPAPKRADARKEPEAPRKKNREEREEREEKRSEREPRERKRGVSGRVKGALLLIASLLIFGLTVFGVLLGAGVLEGLHLFN